MTIQLRGRSGTGERCERGRCGVRILVEILADLPFGTIALNCGSAEMTKALSRKIIEL